MPKYPCAKCNRNVAKRHKAICCDICDKWIHIKCNLLNFNDYKKLQNDPSPFYCIQCTSTIFPYGKLTNNEFYAIATKGVLSPDKASSITQPLTPQIQNHINDLNEYLTKFSSELDDDENLSPINCKYYDPFEFDKAKFNSKKILLHFSP